jgi:hypothetical protein
LAFFELASAEADDPFDPFDCEDDAETARSDERLGAPDAGPPAGGPPTAAPVAGSDLLSLVGRDRSANS